VTEGSESLRQPEQKIDLLSRVFPSGIHVRLAAWTDSKGLVLEGQDTGEQVERIWGDLDYEYWLSVKREHLDRVLNGLAEKLGGMPAPLEDRKAQDQLLLGLLQACWDRGFFETDVDFREWLEGIRVPSEFASYV
jgi:hypothetical protein